MKILFWTNAYAPMIGGAEIWARRYLRALERRGHEIAAIVVADMEGPVCENRLDDIPLLWLPLREAIDRRDPAAFKRALTLAQTAVDRFAPDIVQISNFGVASLLLARMLRQRLQRHPLLLTVHNVWPDEDAAPGSPLDGIVRSASRIATFHTSIDEWLRRRWPATAATVIPHAVPPTALPPAAIPNGAPFLFCGRLSPEKGALTLVDAFARVIAEAPDARLLIAGDGVERDQVDAAIRAHRLGHAIARIGAVQPAGVADLIDRSLAVVIPSFIEGYGLIAAEAAWRARGAIASDVGGLPSTVVHGRTGLLCPPGDPAALARSMLALHRSPRRAAELGAAALQAAGQRPGWPAHVDAFEHLIEAMIRT
ncbi:glycosyltransferase family 4 protein [Flavisphingomonas formosensis]|uniref:glycosyltransferase family 4 protein n=1 Tax=Flavisphingomonas formosensis TaxID=861534 RepID=UPI0012FA846D|nr:glycosyltransferase family 4 protein [Sphingomonas formosensis]